MLISLWRTNLKIWLTRYLVIDTWELRNPTEYNKTNGFLPPLQSIHNLTDAIGTCTANQDIYLTTRFRGDILYDQLPLGRLEQLYSMVGLSLIREYAGIAPLLDFQMVPVTDSIQVIEYGDNLGDWLVTLVFSMDISWIPTVTLLPGDDRLIKTAIDRIDIGLFTANIFSKDAQGKDKIDKVGTIPVKRRLTN